MFSRKTLFWKLAIAGTALLAAVAVYCLARVYPPEILAPFQSTIPVLAGRVELFGSAPSLFYTLALGLLIGSCASTPSGAKTHCMIWLGLALSLEISQHPAIGGFLVSWLADALQPSTWKLVAAYWVRGVFDPLDLLATFMGGAIALYLLHPFPLENNNVHD